MPKRTEATPPKTPDLSAQIAAQVVPLDCGCEGCKALATVYGSDPGLHLFYRRKLLQRGWASQRLPEERAFQAAHATWYAAAAERGAVRMAEFGIFRPTGDAEPSGDDANPMVAQGALL